MRTGLLSDLSVIGYEILLEGETIRLRYQKPDTPPESARQLIDELRKCKAEVVHILKIGSTIAPTEKSQPQSDVKAEWPAEVQSLIDWFITLEPPTEPFYLASHRHIVAPSKFFASLQREIQNGPREPRARMGALQWDLRKLKAFLN